MPRDGCQVHREQARRSVLGCVGGDRIIQERSWWGRRSARSQVRGRLVLALRALLCVSDVCYAGGRLYLKADQWYQSGDHVPLLRLRVSRPTGRPLSPAALRQSATPLAWPRTDDDAGSWPPYCFNTRLVIGHRAIGHDSFPCCVCDAANVMRRPAPPSAAHG
jgi:hypothetical protein